MELELHRIDLVQTSTCLPKTLVVLPLGENKTQKVVVGDRTGVMHCFSVKKGDVVTSFKTLPSSNQVTSVTTGRSAKQKDKIFMAAGNVVQGLNKKGAQFFAFTTMLTDPISSLRVSDQHLWVTCEYVVHHFLEGKDKGLYLAPDKIVDVEVMPLQGPSDLCPVLACRDRAVRVLDSSSTALLFEVPLASPPTTLLYTADSHNPLHKFPAESKQLLVGCEDGRVVQLMLDASAVRQGFTISGSPGAGAVQALYCGSDYSKTGCYDIVVGRDDGGLEVWDVDEQGNPHRVFQASLHESICSVAGGYITSPTVQDIIVQTFTGKIMAFAANAGNLVLGGNQQKLQSQGSTGAGGISVKGRHQALVAALNGQIGKMTAEVEDLKKQIDQERERITASGECVPTSSNPHHIQHWLRLLAEEGCYCLGLESAVPLFTVALHATCPLQLLDVPGNVAIMSRSPPDPQSPQATLATYRCQDSTNRVSIKFRATEGRPGVVTAYPIPQNPPKVCEVITHPILPLCQHERRTGAADSDAAAAQQLPWCEMTFAGDFTLAQAHAWVCQLLPGVPPHPPPGEQRVDYSFNNCQVKSQLQLQYGNGQIMAKSDHPTTLVILHDALMGAATADKVRLTTNSKVAPAALQHALGLLWPGLEQQRAAARKAQLLETLQELKVQEGDASFLDPQYKKILDAADKDAAQQRQQANGGAGSGGGNGGGGSSATSSWQQKQAEAAAGEQLEVVLESIKQLFRDHTRLAYGAAGGNLKQKMAGLDQRLRGGNEQASMQAVLAFMSSG